MPRQDRTGPTGQGALTGRGLGPCGSGNRKNVVQSPPQPIGQGRVRGGRRGQVSIARGRRPR